MARIAHLEIAFRLRIFAALVCASLALLCLPAQDGPASARSNPAQRDPASVRQEFETGAALTRQGKLEEAIPHLLAARAQGALPYAVGTDLAICYVGLGRYSQAIETLEELHALGQKTATSENLLAQAYLGVGNRAKAWEAIRAAIALAPDDEKLYAFLADACNDHREFEIGLRTMDSGIRMLPDSARLHYERGLFLAQLDRIEEARPEFDRAAQLAPDSYISVLALVQKELYDGKIPQATSRLLAFIRSGHRDYQTLSLLGTVLMHAGAAPGQAEFNQAQTLLEESARANPDYSATQIALGKIYDMEGRFAEAVEHLEIARRLEPRNVSIFPTLVHAYRRLGNQQKAREMQAELGRLVAEANRSSNAAP